MREQLLPRRTKKNPAILVQVSILILLGRWLDLYIMIIPPFSGPAPWFGPLEIGIAAGAASLFLILFFRTFSRHSAVSIRDPALRRLAVKRTT